MKHIKCNLCGADNAEKLLSGRDRWMTNDPTVFKLVRCRNCSLVYINPQPTEEELVKFYPTDYSPYSLEYQTFHYSYPLNFLRKIRRMIWPMKPAALNTMPSFIDQDQPKKVLDFGCGGGRFLKLLEKQHPDWDLYGFDIATNRQIEQLTDRIKIYRGQMQVLLDDLTLQSLDIIYLNNSLEHLNDPDQTLRLLIPFLKHGGELFVEVPNIDSIKFKIFGKHFSSLDIPRHLYMFSPQTLRALLQKNGLTIQKTSLSGSSKSLIRSLYFLLRIRTQRLNPLLFRIANLITKLTSNKLNDDVITITTTKTHIAKINARFLRV